MVVQQKSITLLRLLDFDLREQGAACIELVACQIAFNRLASPSPDPAPPTPQLPGGAPFWGSPWGAIAIDWLWGGVERRVAFVLLFIGHVS